MPQITNQLSELQESKGHVTEGQKEAVAQSTLDGAEPIRQRKGARVKHMLMANEALTDAQKIATKQGEIRFEGLDF